MMDHRCHATHSTCVWHTYNGVTSLNPLISTTTLVYKYLSSGDLGKEDVQINLAMELINQGKSWDEILEAQKNLPWDVFPSAKSEGSPEYLIGHFFTSLDEEWEERMRHLAYTVLSMGGTWTDVFERISQEEDVITQ